MKKTKAFTLVEILISITLFSIIILFLYETLNITQKSNDLYSEKLSEKQNSNIIKKIIFFDLMHNDKTSLLLSKNNDEQTTLSMKTTNTYHNPFFQHITYLLSKGELIRVESKKKFDIKKLNDDFFKDSYIDVLDRDIKKFKVVIHNNKQVSFFIQKSDTQKMLFGF
ncbi:MAG: prepilin-type N-terminal cleavage/methylation domain-containing protein [Campylobacterota bacterium]|nr:prepilin-type N-terminal cleavage/methylation domain-containing protein [Campylobacterota bacterium]